MYSEYLADRIRNVLNEKKANYAEKKMMGGLSFMVNDKMCVGIINDDLMARIDPEIYEDSLKRYGVREMDFTKKPMKGWIYVSPEGIDTEDELGEWVQLALDFQSKSKVEQTKEITLVYLS